MKGKIARRLARYVSRTDADLQCATGVVTFTFDDAYTAACDVGARIVEQGEGRATYYVCGALDPVTSGESQYHTAADLRRLEATGHEIACHGFSHLNYQETSSQLIQRDLDFNAEYFRKNSLRPARNFAYPYGCVSPRVKSLCARRFRSSRGVQSALNDSPVDLALLKSVPLYSSSLSESAITSLIRQAKSAGRWLIFFGHNVSDTPNHFDMTPGLLDFTVRETIRADLPILSLDQALDYFGIPANSGTSCLNAPSNQAPASRRTP